MLHAKLKDYIDHSHLELSAGTPNFSKVLFSPLYQTNRFLDSMLRQNLAGPLKGLSYKPLWMTFSGVCGICYQKICEQMCCYCGNGHESFK